MQLHLAWRDLRLVAFRLEWLAPSWKAVKIDVTDALRSRSATTSDVAALASRMAAVASIVSRSPAAAPSARSARVAPDGALAAEFRGARIESRRGAGRKRCGAGSTFPEGVAKRDFS